MVKYPVNPVAPFVFQFSPGIKTYERKDLNNEQLIELCKTIDPDAVYVCGWSDQGYMAAAKSFRKKIPVILTLDNPWRGTFRQYLAALAGPFYLKPVFTHCWVPGEPNARYARKLGFSNGTLFTGLYSADTGLFHGYYNAFRQEKELKFPHRFIFAGRYTELKGILELWQAFLSLSDEERKDWELWCLGKGELEEYLPDHPAIKNCGFIQPSGLAPVLQKTGVFILPAHYEHWGVVVHEFAAAGFPLICSSKTSAATAFLKEGENGYFTVPEDELSIRSILIKVINKSDAELQNMSRRSIELSDTITPGTWAATLWKIAELN